MVEFLFYQLKLFNQGISPKQLLHNALGINVNLFFTSSYIHHFSSIIDLQKREGKEKMIQKYRIEGMCVMMMWKEG